MRQALSGRLPRPFLAVATILSAACHGAPALAPPAVPPRLAAALQLVVVTTPDWDSTDGELRRFVRADAAAPWRRDGAAIPIVIGRTGLAWGVGFDGFAAPGPASEGPRKREGDGRSPAGVFTLGPAFGFPPADSARWVHLPYLPIVPTTECVDDTASVHYNGVVDRSEVAHVDWQSAERMRQIEQYRLGVVVGYNTAPVKARGSCIFLHIWAGPHSTTSGCTALAAGELARLVAWLDPQARPVILQLPVATYARLRAGWLLPDPGL